MYRSPVQNKKIRFLHIEQVCEWVQRTVNAKVSRHNCAEPGPIKLEKITLSRIVSQYHVRRYFFQQTTLLFVDYVGLGLSDERNDSQVCGMIKNSQIVGFHELISFIQLGRTKWNSTKACTLIEADKNREIIHGT